jgi:diguanylate cyclase (GGDEF)-like protein
MTSAVPEKAYMQHSAEDDVGDSARAAAEQRACDAEHILRIVRSLHESLELSDVVDLIANASYEVIGRPVAVWVVEGERARAVSRAGGAMVSLGEERPFPRQVAKRMIMSARDFEASSQLHADAEREWTSSNRAIIPIAQDDLLLGFIAAGPWDGQLPEPRSIAMLYRMAPHAGSAILNARRHADMLRLSLTDALVQLPNRRQLDFFLEKEFNAAQRGRPLCFVIFDLDHFKAYNDTHGHRAGDLALIKFADILRGETRSMNLAARYGGEEFASVLSSTSLSGARAYAERVRRKVEESFDGDLTVSGGVVEFTNNYAQATELVVAADRALYRAKQDGRNRVYVADA